MSAMLEMAGRGDGDLHRGSPSLSVLQAERISALNAGIVMDDLELKEHYDFEILDFQIKHSGVYLREPSDLSAYVALYRKMAESEKLVFRSLFRKAFIKEREEANPLLEGIPVPNVSRPVPINYGNLQLVSSEIQARQNLLSKVIVVKFVSCTKQRAMDTILPIIKQIKALNERYSCNVPLFLVSTFFTYEFVDKVAKTCSDRNLTIHSIKQPLFPYADDRPAKVTSDSFQDELGVDLPPPNNNRHTIFLTDDRIREPAENIRKLPHDKTYPGWYTPGEGYAICHLVAEANAAKGKEYALVLNSADSDDIFDMNILNHLVNVERGFDICLEVKRAVNFSNLNRTTQYLVQVGNRFKTKDKDSLAHDQYFVNDAEDVVLTDNVWISLRFLENQGIDERLAQIAIAKYVEVQDIWAIKLDMSLASFCKNEGVSTVAIEVPQQRVGRTGPLSWFWKLLNPSWATRLKLKMVFTYFVLYAIYHGFFYVTTALLHNALMHNEEGESKKGELILFWIENSLWLVVLVIYTWYIRRRRIRMAGWSRRTQDRERQASIDAYQVVLLASTRFVYSGLNKSSEVNHWFDGNPWLYLGLSHGVAFWVELVGSVLVLAYCGAFSVMEPLEPS